MDRPPVLLLTGFEPFGGDVFNPSGEIARALHGMEFPCGMKVRSLVLPVSGPGSWARLSGAIRRHRPRWVVATGVSGRAEISLETRAWNEADFRIPDNAGWQPRGVPVVRRGPAHFEVRWPGGAGAGLGSAGGFGRVGGVGGGGLEGEGGGGGAVDEAGFGVLPVRSSTDPGRFVCNFLYYRLLHLTRNPEHPAHGRSVFVHLPATGEMRREGLGEARYYHGFNDLRDRVRGLLGEWVGGEGNKEIRKLGN